MTEIEQGFDLVKRVVKVAGLEKTLFVTKDEKSCRWADHYHGYFSISVHVLKLDYRTLYFLEPVGPNEENNKQPYHEPVFWIVRKVSPAFVEDGNIVATGYDQDGSLLEMIKFLMMLIMADLTVHALKPTKPTLQSGT